MLYLYLSMNHEVVLIGRVWFWRVNYISGFATKKSTLYVAKQESQWICMFVLYLSNSNLSLHTLQLCVCTIWHTQYSINHHYSPLFQPSIVDILFGHYYYYTYCLYTLAPFLIYLLCKINSSINYPLNPKP